MATDILMIPPNKSQSPVNRIALIKPCCLGDIVMATALLDVLHRSYPGARIDWYANTGSAQLLEGHPWLDRVIDTGLAASPAKTPGGLWQIIRMLWAGRYDLIAVPDRSPVLAVAAAFSGVGIRAGLDSAGRGLLYTRRARIDPDRIEHEAVIYLKVAVALGLNTKAARTLIPAPVQPDPVTSRLLDQIADRPYLVIHPGGGVNAGMTMISKRWPAVNFADIGARLIQATDATIGTVAVIIGAASDRDAMRECGDHLLKAGIAPDRVILTTELLPLSGVAYLGSRALIYLSNDSGLGHLVTAAGGRVAMIFGPSDPRRYAPFGSSDRAAAIWRPIALPPRGVSHRSPLDFSWERDGVTPDEAWPTIRRLIGQLK